MILKITLDICVRHFLKTRELAMMEDYLDSMELSEEGKRELLSSIEKYDVIALYYTLFERFKDMLSDEELVYYADKGFRLFNENAHFCNIIREVINTTESQREE